jgi:hypothetical protein
LIFDFSVNQVRILLVNNIFILKGLEFKSWGCLAALSLSLSVRARIWVRIRIRVRVRVSGTVTGQG